MNIGETIKRPGKPRFIQVICRQARGWLTCEFRNRLAIRYLRPSEHWPQNPAMAWRSSPVIVTVLKSMVGDDPAETPAPCGSPRLGSPNRGWSRRATRLALRWCAPSLPRPERLAAPASGAYGSRHDRADFPTR